MMFDVVTFGSAVIDTFVDTEFNNKTKSFSYPAGAKILVHNLKSDIGGGATNTGVAFSRLGLKTGSICKIGDDNKNRWAAANRLLTTFVNNDDRTTLADGETVESKTNLSQVVRPRTDT